MKKRLLKIIVCTAMIFGAIQNQAVAQDQAPAFPGAEGHGRYVTGGRGRDIVHVTNLNDSGAGSFRAAVTGGNNRIIVFDVAGVIALNSEIKFKNNLTILGQTAPYPGITLRYYTVRPGTNNIIRFIRFSRGQEKNVNDGADVIWERHLTGIIIDHCSFSWGIDEIASFYDNNNFTMQWCTLGESLCNPGHSKGAHGYGGIWGGKLASFHHNLICHVANRSPRFNGSRYEWTGYTSNKLISEYRWENYVQAENVDFRNCVTYNTNGCYGGPGGGQINMVNNYMKSGPAATVTKLTSCSVATSSNSSDHPNIYDMASRYFVEGNIIDGNRVGWEKIIYDDGTIVKDRKHYAQDPKHMHGSDAEYITDNGTDYVCMVLNQPAPVGEVTTHSAATAFDKVLAYSGASLYRDEVDARYMEEARNGTAIYTGSVTNQKGLIDFVSDCNGYTEENFPVGNQPDDFDNDNDGMADKWETLQGLDPNDASDAMLYTIDKKGWYTNLEVYANALVEDIMRAENKDALSSVNEYYPIVKGRNRCGTPNVSFVGGKLHFECETEGVEYHASITTPNSKEVTGNDINVPLTYVVKVYATKEDYDDSDLTTAEINVQGLKGDVNQDGKVTISDAVGVVNIILEGK